MRVLLVEDEAKLARLVARGLTERGDLVTIAGTGQEALDAALADEEYDVVLLDVQPPRHGGFRSVPPAASMHGFGLR